METKSRVDKISEAVFFIALLIEVLIVIIDKSALINPLEGRLFQLTFLLCMVKIAMTKHNLKEWLLIVLFLGLGLMSDLITERNEIIRFVAFVAASKGIDGRKALKMVLFTSLIGVISLVALSLFGVLGTVYLETDFAREVGVERRYCLGLGHPNALHCMFWALLTLGVYLYCDKLKWWHYAVLMVANIGLFALTGSRTGVLVAGMVIVCGVVALIIPKISSNKALYLLSELCLFVCVGFSIRVAYYNGFRQRKQHPILNWIDGKLTGRLLDSGFSGNAHKWSMFSDCGKKGYIDMGYIKLYHWYGIIPATIYILIIIFMIIRCYRKKDIASLILIMSFTVYTTVEAHAVSVFIGRNYMIMLLFGTWSELFRAQKGEEGYFWQVKKYLDLKTLWEK